MATGLLTFAIAGFGGSAGPEFFYAATSASAQRKGLFMSAISGSPHMALVPRSGSPDFLLVGDVWFEESGSTGDGNFFVAEQSTVGGVIVTHRIVTSREDEISIEQIVSRFTSSDAPSDLRIGANAIVLDNFYVTINSAGVSGALVRNDTFGGGLFMSDADTVAVFGVDKDFLVPSGSVIVERGNFTLLSGSLQVTSGNIILQGDSSSFNISGSSISASLQGNPIASVLTGSVESGSLSPTPIDGTIYVNTASGDISVRASESFFDLDVDAPDAVDGGFFFG